MEEIWKPIKDYEGLYEISNFGRVKSLEKEIGGRVGNRVIRKEKILSLKPSNIIYVNVHLCVNNKIKPIGIHRLVAEAFIPNPENKPQVNHKDGIRNNNHVDNLEWVTASENTIHALKNGFKKVLRGSQIGNSILKEHEVLKIREIGKSLTQKEIGDMFGVSNRHISDILARKRWKHI